MINIVFMGTPDYASAIMEALHLDDAINVQALYTQPDKPVGRKQVLTPPHAKKVALTYDIPVYQPENFKSEAVVDELKVLKPDMIIVAAFGQILPKSVLDIAPCINLHASILPHLRGASPIQQVLLEDEKITGVSAMLMDIGLDTGDILAFRYVGVLPTTMLADLFADLTKAAALLAVQTVHRFNMIEPVKQESANASLCKKITKNDGLVSFRMDAQTIVNRYRGLTPWPGIYLKSGLKIKAMQTAVGEKQGKIGEIIAIEDDVITVATSNGSIAITKLQAPSKKEVDAIAYLNGKGLKRGDVLS
jgi:methionyl-tRNA formyltransferase